MGFQPVTEQRREEIRKLLADRQSRPGTSCESLKAQMDALFGSCIGDILAAGEFMALYLQALIMGCDLNTNPYHADPFSGDPYQIQMVAYPWDVRGSKLMMYDADHNVLFSDNINRQDGGDDPADDVYDLFRLVPAGQKFNGRQGYFVVVQTGAHAGKALNADPELQDDGTRHIHALEFDVNTVDRWILSDEMDANDNSAGSGRAYNNYSVQGEHRGRMDVPGGKGGHPMLVWPEFTGNCNQLFHARPPAFK
ncbi:hypothetical protein [Kitasatospora sp. NPDC096140]|uniref:hypothetical protein n=1 Tax=Kitasatospora sp. NPDC096140 TaxID=3155425 RepID=UPI003326CCC2